ncbi:MAG: hypothetical protein EOP41_07570 [Sphingobacteriaceae bacterium]|nr:MAG: hypothetical protein EOP41_07570 [Sphingobacteriaceae bacterium]
MATASSNLNEVVVVGYGTTTRQEITGAISSIKASQIAQTLSPTLDQALQGKVAGVVVNSNSGQPGGGVSVQIRGVSTLGNAQPLYVVDGVFFDGGDTNSQVYTGGAPTTNPLATINPSDIESMDVLKDASATAIYGSRGSNGVVIITTKKGRVGAPKINFDTYFGVQQLPNQIPVLNLQQYAVFRNERDRIFFNIPRIEFQDPSILGRGTNWQDVIFKNAPMQNYNLSIGGGDARTTYQLSGGYFNQEGIAVKSGFKRLNTRLNLENKTTNWLRVGANLQVTRTNEQINNQDGNLIQLAIRQSPDIAAINPDGSFGGPSSSEFVLSNPYGLTLLSTNERQRSQIYGNLFADITFLKDFVLRNEYAANYEFGNIIQFTPTYQFGQLVNNTSQGSRASNTFGGNTLRTYLTYNHTFLELLKVNGTLGHESLVNRYSSLIGTGSG